VLIDALSKSRPGYGFLAEERGLVEGTDKTHVYIIDPLDGTTNFLHSIPQFAINIALEREGQIVAGVTYNPIANELFWAERGKGAFLNDRRLRVAARTQLLDALLATGIPFAGRPGHARFLKELHQVTQRVSGVRRFGSAALDLAWTAAGRYDGYWERNLNAWDIAAGVLLVTEAGGKVSSADGEPVDVRKGSICASNQELHPLILQALKLAS
jgi:myo-inositol-1(or 4)-monophosphatase